MIGTTLSLETTPDRFINRLAQYARENRCKVIVHEDGLILAPPGREIDPTKIPPKKYGSLNIVFLVYDLGINRVEVELLPGRPEYEDYLHHLLEKINEWWPRQTEQLGRLPGKAEKKAKHRGAPRLEESDPDELLYRMAKRQEAEEMREAAPSPKPRWEDIAEQIGWLERYGRNDKYEVKAALTKLREAGYKLERLRESDPDGWLPRIKEFREREARKKRDN